MKILIVEDDKRTAEALKDSLEFLGHEDVFLAHNYADGFQMIVSGRPDIVFIDHHMPKNSRSLIGSDIGYGLYDVTKEHAPGAMVVGISSYGDHTIVASGFDVPPFRLLKGSSNIIDELKKLIEEYLARAA